MKIRINQGIPNGTVSAPPSKSYAHRYLIASMLSEKKCTITNIELSKDITATLDCLKAYGFSYIYDHGKITLSNNSLVKDVPLFKCNESGSTLRFFIPIAATKFEHFIINGTEKLLSRGLEVYEDICKKQNIEFIKTASSVEIKGKLKPDDFSVPGDISSQFITGLLFALPLLDGDSTITITTPLQSKMYVDMTLDILSKFGINIKIDGNKFIIPGNQQYIVSDSYVEGDYSNASFFAAYNYLGGNIEILGLNPFSLQGDKVYIKYFELLDKDFQTLDISNCIDLGPVLFTFAALKHGAKFTGTKRLEIKESDRALSMKEELAKVGIDVEINEDDVVINKSELHEPTEAFLSHNDHRIAMALSLFASLYTIEIEDYEAINKSFPAYFKKLGELGMEIKYYDAE